MKKTLLIGLLLIAFFAKAQDRNVKKCATTPLVEYEMQKNPQYKNITVECVRNNRESQDLSNLTSQIEIPKNPNELDRFSKENYITVSRIY